MVVHGSPWSYDHHFNLGTGPTLFGAVHVELGPTLFGAVHVELDTLLETTVLALDSAFLCYHTLLVTQTHILQLDLLVRSHVELLKTSYTQIL